MPWGILVIFVKNLDSGCMYGVNDGGATFTWIVFSCRLRYLVFSDILSGTWSKLFLVQMTLLAWLEQVQRVGHGGAAPVSWGPWLGNHNKSWTNQRRGEGVKGLVTMTRRMATESWPTPIAMMLISHLQKEKQKKKSEFKCLSRCSCRKPLLFCSLKISRLKKKKKKINRQNETLSLLLTNWFVFYFAHGSVTSTGLVLFLNVR